jgi:hypothetical protein
MRHFNTTGKSVRPFETSTSEIFLQAGLDRANQLDAAAENRFLAQTIFHRPRRFAGPIRAFFLFIVI